ncbi:MAG: hypothetical protein AAF711_01985 [Planctomycetota bacterium]
MFQPVIKSAPLGPSLLVACLACCVAGDTVAAVITYSGGDTLTQSTTDDLQGIDALGWRNSGPSSIPTDAASGSITDGSLNTFGNTQTMTFDLGAAGAATRQLDSLQLAVSSRNNNNGGDSNRFQWGGIIQVSSDDVVYTDVATLLISGPNASFFNTFNVGLVEFTPGEVTGFQYLRLDETRETASGGTYNFNGRIVEVDAEFSVVPEPAALYLIGAGVMFILGPSRRLDESR